MSKINHFQARNLIQAAMDGPVNPTEKEKLSLHLVSCDDCQDYARQMNALESKLRNAFHMRWDPTSGPSPWVEETIYKKMRANLMKKNVFSLVAGALAMGVIAIIASIAISNRPFQNEPVPGGQITSTETPGPVPTITPRNTPTATATISWVDGCAARADKITHIVQRGDTIFSIADYFCLRPETILIANSDVLQGDPSLLSVGMKLKIPPRDTELVWGLPSYKHVDPELADRLGPGTCQDQASETKGTGTFIWPTRKHTVSGMDYSPKSKHLGIDLAGEEGDDVYASDRGTIIFAGWNSWGYGYLVVIDHGNGNETLYAFLNSVDVACGQTVEQGAVIGKIGSTGNAAGTMLHFEMNVDNQRVNPEEYLPSP